jgi:TAT (twin-arginine translocation) pathway-exported protein
MVTRRQFLKHAIATGVVAAVAPALLTKTKEIFPFDKPLPDSVFVDTPMLGRSLTYTDLENAYQSVVMGHEEPDLIWVHDVRTYRFLAKMYEDVRYREEFLHADLHV